MVRDFQANHLGRTLGVVKQIQSNIISKYVITLSRDFLGFTDLANFSLSRSMTSSRSEIQPGGFRKNTHTLKINSLPVVIKNNHEFAINGRFAINFACGAEITRKLLVLNPKTVTN